MEEEWRGREGKEGGLEKGGWKEGWMEREDERRGNRSKVTKTQASTNHPSTILPLIPQMI